MEFKNKNIKTFLKENLYRLPSKDYPLLHESYKRSKFCYILLIKSFKIHNVQ